jgi:outer membrane protein assembly factor BamB
MKPSSVRLASLGIACLLVAGGGHAAEWPSWRGGGYDGVSSETGLVSNWSPDGENLIWKAAFVGRSTPVVLDAQACVIGRVGQGIDRQEVVACFDAVDGRKRWEHRFNVYNTTVPFNRVGWASLVGDPETGNIYAHGVAGQLNAYDHDGKILWSRFLGEEFGRLSGYGGRTQTPLIDGDQLILSSVSSGWGKHAAPRHRYFSFDKRTGEVLWIATPGKMPFDMNTQSVPVIAEIGGRRMLVSGNADGYIYALDANTGQTIWSFQLSRRGINSSVLVAGDRVFASHSEENVDDSVMGRLVSIDGTGTGDVSKTHEVWRINELSAGFPSPAFHDGRLYVIDNSANLHSILAKTGHIVWKHSLGTVGKGSPVIADGKLYATEVNGRFHIIEPGADAPRQLDMDELTVPDGRYAEIYGSPAIAYGRVYFTTEGGIYCLGRRDGTIPEVGHRVKPATVAGAGEPAWIQVVPAEVLIRPGERADFEVRAFDSKGRALGTRKAEWKLDRLSGSLDSGRFEPAPDSRFQAGEITASVGSLASAARVRVVPDLPWFEDFEAVEAGGVPPHWIGAPKKWEVREQAGGKVLVKLVRPKGLLRNALYMGPSTMSNFTIEADVMGAQKGRRRTDVGVIANGYTLDLMGNHQRIQIRTWPSEERVATEVPYAWEMGKWYHMKLRVAVDEKQALVQGKVWPRGEDEPTAWSITVQDPYPIESGSPGLVAYSPADAFFDNIKVTVNDQ